MAAVATRWRTPCVSPLCLLLLGCLCLSVGRAGAGAEAAGAGVEVRVEALPLRSAVPKGRAFKQAVLFRLSAAAPPGPAPASPRAAEQELCIALDVSSSMEGRKSEVARHAIGHIAQSMQPGDRLHVLTFNQGARLELRDVTASAAARKRLLDTLKALPQTASAARHLAAPIPSAVASALQRVEKSDLLEALELLELRLMPEGAESLGRTPRRLFILSDGLTSGGATEYWQVLAAVERLTQKGFATSVFAVGGDHEQRLLRSMAEAGHGAFVWMDGSADSIRALRDRAAFVQEVPATRATLWLTPEHGADALTTHGHRRRGGSAAVGAIGDRLHGSEMVPIGTLPLGFTKEVLVEVNVPAVWSSTPYLFYELAYETPEGSPGLVSGRLSVAGLAAHPSLAPPAWPAPAAPPTTTATECVESGDQEPLERFSQIGGALWEVTERWNCGSGYSSISSHVKAVTGTAGSVDDRRWCAARCVAVEECVAFGYPHPGDGRCWLKSGDDARMSSRLRTTCGAVDSTTDYYTLLERKVACPKARCADIVVAGASMLNTSDCSNARSDGTGSDGNGVYVCSVAAYNGKNAYKLVEGFSTWEMRWELGPMSKWVVLGNGHYRYFVASTAGEPPRAGWSPRTAENTDRTCAQGSISLDTVQHSLRDDFVEYTGVCTDAGGVVIGTGYVDIGVLEQLDCEEACRARSSPSCTAFQRSSLGTCVLHTSAAAAGGDALAGSQCYVRAKATEVEMLSPGRRCANVHKTLGAALLSPEACASLAAFEPGCGSLLHVVRGPSGGGGVAGCSCIAAGLRCEEQPDTNSDVYEIVRVSSTHHGVELRRDLEHLLALEEEAQLDAQLTTQAPGRAYGKWNARLANGLDALAARAKRLSKLDPTLVTMGVIERIMDLESRWHRQTSACAGAPSSCRAAATGSPSWLGRPG